jgi:hypothetical protein
MWSATRGTNQKSTYKQWRNYMQTSEILNKAADEIERRGWQAGDGWDWTQDGPLCLEGGIAAAAGIDVMEWRPAYRFILNDDGTETQESFVRRAVNNDVYAEFEACPAYVAVKSYLVDAAALTPENQLWNYNDRSTVSQEKVIEVLRAAAMVESVKEQQEVTV